MEHKQTGSILDNKVNNQDMILSLIEKEIEGTKFIKELQRVGFDTTVYTPDLCDIITAIMGITKKDDLWDWYFKRLDAHTDNYTFLNKKQLKHEAYLFYLELMDYASG